MSGGRRKRARKSAHAKGDGGGNRAVKDPPMDSSMDSPIPPANAPFPDVDCTAKNFFLPEYAKLNDRQRIRWALSTENKVRFAKLEKRGNFAISAEDGDVGALSTTLKSDYLIDFYPHNETRAEESSATPSHSIQDEDLRLMSENRRKLERDVHAYLRKRRLPTVREPDDSFRTLERPKIRGRHERTKKAINRKMSHGFTPNFLFFKLILEGFMGYEIPRFHSKDKDFPRAAVMGGAVVAALTAWNDDDVRQLFQRWKISDILESKILRLFGRRPQRADVERYFRARRQLVLDLNCHFLHDTKEFKRDPKMNSDHFDDSDDYSSVDDMYRRKYEDFPVFSTGDVDIFLQASPLTRSLLRKLHCDLGLPQEVTDYIADFIGGCGFVQEDLSRFARAICDKHLEPVFADKHNAREALMGNAFVYAISRNSVSFTYAVDDVEKDFDTSQGWPRTTQLIMLNERADLLGGLMDFDISVASCAYDGTGVMMTPRAFFSLFILTQVVTPFIVEEKRNQGRIGKYYKRGFDVFIVDPCCSHASQCRRVNVSPTHGDVLEPFSLDKEFDFHGIRGVRGGVLELKNVKWRSRDIQGEERYYELVDALDEDSYSDEPVIGIQCCCDIQEFDCRFKLPPSSTGEDKLKSSHTKFAIVLFEKCEGHGMQFFAERFNWTAEQREQVAAFPATRRFSCQPCRREYAVNLIMAEAPPVDGDEDVLHGETYYRHTIENNFHPSFYGGSAFNSHYAGFAARSTHQMLNVLSAQCMAEKARYVHRHGTDDGFAHRFFYGVDLMDVFVEASKSNFPVNKRAPIGLNPERFINKCDGCNAWLHGCEFGIRYCEVCSESKPAASEQKI